MNAKERRLAAYARQILSNSLGGVEIIRESFGLRMESAAGALESASRESAFRPGESFALEAIVLPKLRPVAFVRANSFENLPDPWAHVSAYRDELKPVFQAVGRIEVENAGIPYGGTGFLCGPNLILTNRHVAELFMRGVGTARLRSIPGRDSRLEMGHEHLVLPVAGPKFKTLKTLMVHPHWDAAFLQVQFEGDPALVPAPLTLASAAPDDFVGREILAVGYPYWSEGHDPAVIKEVFGDVFGVKRIQPGKLMPLTQVESFQHSVEALSHEASTLGGNSGSAVVDLETQQVLGLHFAGAYLEANFAVPSWALAQDPRVVDLGVRFAPPLGAAPPRTPDNGGPIWLSAWKGREAAPVAPPGDGPTLSAAPVPSPAPGPEKLSGAQVMLLDPGWFEQYSDEELRRLYQRDPEQFRALLAATFSEEEAQEIYDTVLFGAAVEGVRERVVNPALPEIVLLPGIFGSHLRGSFWGRSWLNLLTLPFSNPLGTLGLDANGNDPHSLAPDGYLGFAYAKAARAWRKDGHVVHEFSYDWRQTLATSARRLDGFLRARRRGHQEARFAFVGHGMGGLVGALYARDIPDWRDFVSHAVLCGVPFGGTVAIMEMLSGESPFVRKLASISPNAGAEEIRQMIASFPGALEMLPDPALFRTADVEVEMLYRPTSYAPSARPGADWLRAARKIKGDLRESPLLDRSTCLVGVKHATAGAFTVQNGEVRRGPAAVCGDATVAAVSAVVEGVPAYRVGFEHGDLLRDPAVIEAVPLLLRGTRLPHEPVTAAGLKEPLAEAQPNFEALAAKWERDATGVRARMRAGISTADDVRWLLNPK